MQKAAEEDPFKPDEGVTMEEDKIVLLGDEELNAAMAKYYEAHPSAFQWSLWQQVEYSISPALYSLYSLYSLSLQQGPVDTIL